eukprot:623505-Pleurochrysis_carterae.AAC.1
MATEQTSGATSRYCRQCCTARHSADAAQGGGRLWTPSQGVRQFISGSVGALISRKRGATLRRGAK